MKDYCASVSEVRPFYWLEESADLYARASSLLGRLKQMPHILDTSELESLIDIDLDLISLWQSFEKDSMLGVEKLKNKSIKPLRVPLIFGYPDTIFYYNGIIISKMRVRCA